MKHPLNLGRAEMEVLRFVAHHAPVTVREVADHLAETKGHVRTTVLNSMERLREKGFLRRRKVEGVFQYFPAEGRTPLHQRLIAGFVDAAFGGSRAPVAAYLAQSEGLTAEELRVLQRMAERLESRDT